MRAPRWQTLVLLTALALAVLTGGVLGSQLLRGALVEEWMQRWAREELGRELAIDGTVGLRLASPIAIAAEKVRLANAPGFRAQSFATAEIVRLHLRPLPLLRGRLELAAIELRGLSLNLERDRHGHGNWPERVGGPSARPAGARASLISSAVAGSLADRPTRGRGAFLRIDAAQVSWDDRATGQAWQLDEIDLRATRPALGEAIDWWLDMPVSDVGPVAQARMHGEGSLTIDTTGPGSMLCFFAVDVSGLQVSGTLRAEELGEATNLIGRVSLSPLDLRAWLSKTATVALPSGNETAWRSVRGEVSLLREREDLVIDEIALQVDETAISGRGRLLLTWPIGLRLVLDADRLDLGRYLPLRLEAWDGVAQRGSPTGSQALAAVSPVRLAVAALPPSGEMPREALLPQSATDPRSREAHLPGLDLEAQLGVAALTASLLDFGPADLSVTAKDGLFALEQRADAFYGGRLDGRLTLDRTKQPLQVALAAQVEGVEIGPLLEDLRATPWLSGTGDLDLDLQARGSSLAEIRPTLGGQLALSLRDGAVQGLDLDALIAAARGALSGRASDVRLQGESVAAFSSLTASGVVHEGVLTNDDLVGHSDLFTVTGRGSLDLVRERFDYRLEPMLVEGPDGRGIKELEGIPIPVMITGRFNDPSWSLDLGPLLREAARRRLDQRAGGLIDELEDRLGVDGLGEGLRGLLGY